MFVASHQSFCELHLGMSCQLYLNRGNKQWGFAMIQVSNKFKVTNSWLDIFSCDKSPLCRLYPGKVFCCFSLLSLLLRFNLFCCCCYWMMFFVCFVLTEWLYLSLRLPCSGGKYDGFNSSSFIHEKDLGSYKLDYLSFRDALPLSVSKV